MRQDDPDETPEITVRPGMRQALLDGRDISLEPRVFDLLLLLAERHGEVVDKDTMLARVWAGRPVSDDAISAALRDLRRALGDDGRRQRIIRTVYGRGVRLVVAAKVESDGPPAIAILPFEAPGFLSEIARALFVDVTTAITRARTLPVISHRSAMQLVPGASDSSDCAKRLCGIRRDPLARYQQAALLSGRKRASAPSPICKTGMRPLALTLARKSAVRVSPFIMSYCLHSSGRPSSAAVSLIL